MRSPTSRRVRIRPVGPDDADALDRVFSGLSAASRHARYLGAVDRLTPSMRRALSDVDQQQHVALLAEARTRGTWTAIGLARYVVDEPGRAEIAYEVVDAWQGRGIGGRLVRELVATARRNDVARLHASVSVDNHASLALLRRVLPQLRVQHRHGVLEVAAWLVDPPWSAADLMADLEAA